MSKPKMLYKYMGSNTLDKILGNNSLKISTPSEFNDPFDSSFPGYSGKVKVTNEIERMFAFYLKNSGVYDNEIKNFIRSSNHNKDFNKIMLDSIEELRDGWDKYIDNYKILCLSKSKDNILMWSHYGQYHKGAVLGFDFSDEDFFHEISEVKYNIKDTLVDDLVKKGLSHITNFVVKHPASPDVALDELDALMDKDNVVSKIVWYAVQNLHPSFFIKKYIWHYEEEHRLVRLRTKNESSYLSFKPSSVKEVIFGINMDKDEKMKVIDILSKHSYPIDIYQAKKKNSNIHFDNITSEILK